MTNTVTYYRQSCDCTVGAYVVGAGKILGFYINCSVCNEAYYPMSMEMPDTWDELLGDNMEFWEEYCE